MAFRRLFPFDVVADGAVTGSPVAPQINLAPATQNIFFGIDDSGNLWVNDAQVGGNSSLIQTSTVTLTDAQIKALPTTPIQLVAAPGNFKLLRLVGAVLVAQGQTISGTGLWPTITDSHAFVNLYTNVDNNVQTAIVYGPTADESASNINLLSLSFFNLASETLLLFTPAIRINGGANEVDENGMLQGASLNLPLSLWIQNGVLGDFTGGNSSNTIKVITYYTVVDLS